jgi:activated CDC42 kinase 1
MAKPAARRLLDLVKKKRRKAIVSKLFPAQLGKLSGTLSRKRQNAANNLDASTGPLALTCLVQAKDVALFDKLGDGSFGVVRRGEWTTATGRILPVAAKVLKKETLNQPGKTGSSVDYPVLPSVTGKIAIVFLYRYWLPVHLGVLN